MAEEKFGDNLLRLIAAQNAHLVALAASREMFARSYYSLGPIEKAAVDQATFAQIAANYQAITPEFLTGQASAQPVGFHPASEGS